MSQDGAPATPASDDRYARSFVRDIAPIWHDRFARLIVRELPRGLDALALDVHCRHGQLSEAILHRLAPGGRLLALQAEEHLTPRLQARILPEWQSRFYVRQGNFDSLLDFPDAEYDLTIANLVLGEEVSDWQAGLDELIRITKPGGRVLATMCLQDTWGECDDLFAEVLEQHGLEQELQLHRRFRERRPTPQELDEGLESLGLGPNHRVIAHERFRLLFRSGRELLFAPVVERGPLQSWKAITARCDKPQEIMWHFKEAIDAYHLGRSLAVTVHAGLLNIEVPGKTAPRIVSEYWQRFSTLDQVFSGHTPRPGQSPGPGGIAPGDHDDELEFDIEIEEDSFAGPRNQHGRNTNPYPTTRAAGQPDSHSTKLPTGRPEEPHPERGHTRSHPVLDPGSSRPRKPQDR